MPVLPSMRPTKRVWVFLQSCAIERSDREVVGRVVDEEIGCAAGCKHMHICMGVGVPENGTHEESAANQVFTIIAEN